VSSEARAAHAEHDPATVATITAIRATEVNLPLVAPYRWVAGLYHGSTKVVVEVETSAGITGLGEGGHWRHAALIREELAPRLLGRRATDLNDCWRAAVPPVETLYNTDGLDAVRAYGAIDMALWDIRGKLAGVPIHELLGGALRKRIPFAEYFAMREAVGAAGGESTPEQLGEYCQRMVEEFGSPFFEGKVGHTDLETDVAVARSVREAIGPRRTLRLDANMGWRVSTAREALHRIEPYDIANVEDPVGSIEEMARLRVHTRIPFSTHVPDLRSAARLGVPDSFVLNLTSLGGISRTLRFIAACEALGVDFTFYSGESGIGTAAYLQIAAADPHLGLPSQSLLRWYTNDVIVNGPFQPYEGHIDVPDTPGLGIELDRAALASAHAAFDESGPIETAAIDPIVGYLRRPPLY
jgi:glucarate dehydratase